MSQKGTRKSQNPTVIIINDDKEKADTPVKEMKKKIAANTEKDKHAAEKTDKPTDKSEPADKNKPTDKPDKNADKSDKSAEKSDKSAEKLDKSVEKSDKKAEKSDKSAEKSDKSTEKKSDKSEKATDKKSDKGGDKKADKSLESKSEQAEKDESKGDKAKEKATRAVNGHNGASNGDDANGTVSDSDGDLVIEEDEAFPELTYDDSDSEYEEGPARSLTRRSQVKATKTPETPAPRPASGKESDDPKDSKVLKLNEAVAPSDRKLRSADSPKPEKKSDKKQDSPKKLDTVQEEEKKSTKKDLEASKKEQNEAEKEAKDGDKTDKMDVEVIEVESVEGPASRTRARVSPYSRPRLDRTATSVTADYTGNNSTMEMDITEGSSFLEEGAAANDSGYLRGLRGIRGRSSYKLLKDLQLTNPHASRPRPPPTAGAVRPTGAVVGRKRKPSADAAVEAEDAADLFSAHGKRMRLLDRLSLPFRRTVARQPAEIVGINTDLPLTAPVASASFAAFDPETIKPAPAPDAPLATPLPPAPHDRDGKRCIVM